MNGLFNPLFSGFVWDEPRQHQPPRRRDRQWLPGRYKVAGGRKLKVGDRVRGIMPVGNPVIGTVAEISIEFDEAYWEEKLNFEGYKHPRSVNVDTLAKTGGLVFVWVKVKSDDGSEDCYFGLDEVRYVEGEPMNRAEHLAWAKARAIAYCDAGDWRQAFASIASDLNKHPDTRGHSGLALGMRRIADGDLNSPEAMRKFIDGFN